MYLFGDDTISGIDWKIRDGFSFSYDLIVLHTERFYTYDANKNMEDKMI